MKHNIFVFLVCMLVTSMVSAATVKLKENHDVQREFLTLSDFFEGVSPDKDQDILEAPSKGESKYYAHSWVQQLAQNFGLIWKPEHTKGISLARAQDFTTKINVQESIQTYLEHNHPEKLAHDIGILIEGGVQMISVKQQSAETAILNLVWIDDNKFVVTFDIGGQEKKIRGSLRKMVYVPVLNKQLHMGCVIEENDLEYKLFPAQKVTAYVIKDEKDLIGKTLRRHNVKEGEVLGAHDVINPVVMKRGDLITMRVETPTVVISTRGKVQGNASVGQSVQVMNLDSKRLVEGVVRDAQTVIIPVGTPH